MRVAYQSRRQFPLTFYLIFQHNLPTEDRSPTPRARCSEKESTIEGRTKLTSSVEIITDTKKFFSTIFCSVKILGVTSSVIANLCEFCSVRQNHVKSV